MYPPWSGGHQSSTRTSSVNLVRPYASEPFPCLRTIAIISRHKGEITCKTLSTALGPSKYSHVRCWAPVAGTNPEEGALQLPMETYVGWEAGRGLHCAQSRLQCMVDSSKTQGPFQGGQLRGRELKTRRDGEGGGSMQQKCSHPEEC